MTRTSIEYGIVAMYETPAQLVDAARELHNSHYTTFEAYSPYPIHELNEIVPVRNPLPAMVFIGGLLGVATAWSMQTYIAVFDYPLNIGGRPLYSWPSFIVILFELTVLFASLTAFFGSLFLSGFPRIFHPLFGFQRFASVTSDGFFLCVPATDPIFEPERTVSLLRQFDPLDVREIKEV